MKPITKQSKSCASGKKAAFTIVELLTVMSIIVILIGLLVPSLNMAKRYAKEVKQKAQFHSIDAAMELFNGEWEGYPPSSALDEDNKDYCGAMKLCEAMVGQDLMGFHPNSRFRADCTTDGTNKIYDNPPNSGVTLFPSQTDNLKARKGPYLQTENANAYRLWHLYGTGNTAPFDKDLFVLCDVYSNVKNQDTGRKIGMPILYYKAHTSNTIHDPNGTFPTVGNDGDYIYNYTDNDKLVGLGPPPWGIAGPDTHPLYGPTTNFYEITQDKRISIKYGRPYRPDSYILISAGFDGMYGTKDDVFNF